SRSNLAGKVDRQVSATSLDRRLAGGSRDQESSTFLEQDQERAGVDKRAAPLRDQLQDAIELRLAAERPGDLGRGFETVDGVLQLLSAVRERRVKTSVVDRNCGPVG